MTEPALDMDLLRRVSDSVVIARSDETICFANDSLHALVGSSRSLVGHPVRSIIRHWRRGANPAEATKTFLLRADGLSLPVELLMSSWHQHGADFTGAIVRSIADRDAAMAKLKEQQEQANAALAEARVSQKRLEQVVEMLPQAVCVFDAEDRYVLWNHRYAELYPEIAGHLRAGTPFVDILRLSLASGEFPEIVEDAEGWLSERLAKHARPAWREEQEMRDGRWMLHDDRRLADGGAIGMRIDITDIKRREASFRLLFQSNPVPMLLFEPETLRIVDANDAASSFYGLARAAFLSLSVPDLHLESERDAAAQTFGALVDAYEGRAIWHHRTATGSSVDVLVFVRISKHQEQPCFLAAIVDVSDRIHAEAQIAHIAHHDPLTGLANRIRFRQTAEAALAAEFNPGEQRLVIHCIDLDGFKPVNDLHGHSTGDRLLRMVGERLQAVVRRGDLVARLGGDEFAVIQTSGFNEAEQLAGRLVACLGQSFRVEGVDVQIGASLGFATAPDDGDSLDQLMIAADAALYDAKAAGRGVWRAASRGKLKPGASAVRRSNA